VGGGGAGTLEELCEGGAAVGGTDGHPVTVAAGGLASLRTRGVPPTPREPSPGLVQSSSRVSSSST
jgi:hypothetical protein